MAWHPCGDVTMATVGGDLVILDVAQDAYHCLPGGAAAVRRTAYGLDIEDRALAQELSEAGLIEARTGGRVGQRPAPTPAADLSGQLAPRATLAERLSFAGATLTMSHAYHGRSLLQMVTRARRRGEAPGRYSAQAPDPAVIRRAAIFEDLLPWAPRQEACLYRAFMLLEFLGDRGRAANWVFGVRTRPFEAHCWVQAGAVVLNDNADHARNYVPILVT